MVYSTAEGYRFRVRCANADSVNLLGDFNDWSTTSHPMTPTEDGAWELALDPGAGPHRFAYFVLLANRDGDRERIDALASLVLEEDVDVSAPMQRTAS
jgi:1,4-alpha-glucan branching enzyme